MHFSLKIRGNGTKTKKNSSEREKYETKVDGNGASYFYKFVYFDEI